jgi:hypothetical protein
MAKYKKEAKGNILTGSKASGHNIHPSSQKPSSSGNLYKYVPKSAIDKQDVKSHGKYGI